MTTSHFFNWNWNNWNSRNNCNALVTFFYQAFLPRSFCPTGLDECLQLARLVTEQGLDECLAQSLGEPQLEDHVLLRLLRLAVGRAEQHVVAAAAVLGVGR